MRTVIRGGTIVNEGRSFVGDVVIEGERIEQILPANPLPSQEWGGGVTVIDATGCYVLPGIIDEHVHFREPGLTEKADMESESRAAAAGGVTSFFDMPNTVPQTTTLEALDEKYRLAAQKSHVNYAFFFGATNDNTSLFSQLDPHRIPGIKLFMGSSTGNMLVDRDEALERIFSEAPLPVMAHCEDTAIINQNMAAFKAQYGDDPDIWAHQLIRSEEACLASTRKALELAVKHHTRLHIAHVSTAEELEMISPLTSHLPITVEATVGHLLFSTVDYDRLGSRIKVNPAIKSCHDQEALRQGLMDGRISVVATDHAPHLLAQKEGGCARAASGMPMLQFSLVAMLELVDEGVLTLERLVELMAHNPASIFQVRERGFLRPGYKADITIVRPHSPWTVTPDIIESKCGWSPMEGHTFNWRVEQTLCNGHLIYYKGIADRSYIGQAIHFR
ncbi:MAG: dihydroorotase [Prevotella sp.]|nr:dihydroorotase [Prevotella sp.]